MTKSYVYYGFLEFADEINGKYYLTVDYALKVLNYYYLNKPIYTTNEDDSKNKSNLSFWLKDCKYKKNNRNDRLYEVRDVYNLFEEKKDVIQLWKNNIELDYSVKDLLDIVLSLIKSIDELGVDLLNNIGEIEGSLFKILHAVNLGQDRKNNIHSTNIISDIKTFNNVKQRYRDIQNEYKNILMPKSLSQYIESNYIHEYINITDLSNIIYSYLYERFGNKPLYYDDAIKKKQLRTMLRKNDIKPSKIKGLNHYKLSEVIQLFSPAQKQFTINGWFFKSKSPNGFDEVNYIRNKLHDVINNLTEHIKDINELINQMIAVEKKTIEQIYQTIKSGYSNPFYNQTYIKDFDKKVNDRLKSTSEFSSIYEEIQESDFALYLLLDQEQS